MDDDVEWTTTPKPQRSKEVAKNAKTAEIEAVTTAGFANDRKISILIVSGPNDSNVIFHGGIMLAVACRCDGCSSSSSASASNWSTHTLRVGQSTQLFALTARTSFPGDAIRSAEIAH